MSGGGGVGMDIRLDLVPTRQADMEPFEILLSESQERMLVVVKKGREAEIEAIFDKWDLHAVEIGVVTEGNTLRYFDGEELIGEVPADSLILGGGAPVYEREYSEPGYLKDIAAFDLDSIPEPTDYVATAKALVSRPNLASKRWVYEQYDSMVGTVNRSTNRPGDAAVVRVKGSKKGLALSVDCNGRYVEADPRKGCAIAVAEAARNIACVGGTPSAITNCLNFANPQRPEIMSQFVHALEGMGAACRALDFPIVSGNVSLYNETNGEAILPTPAIGGVGVIADIEKTAHMAPGDGDTIYLLGETKGHLGQSLYLREILGQEAGPPPPVDLIAERKHGELVRKLIGDGKVSAVHDLSDGGLAVALLDMLMAGKVGATVEADLATKDAGFWFGEDQGRYLLATSDAAALEAAAGDVPLVKLATVSGTDLVLGDDSVDLDSFKSIHENWLPSYMNGK